MESRKERNGSQDDALSSLLMLSKSGEVENNTNLAASSEFIQKNSINDTHPTQTNGGMVSDDAPAMLVSGEEEINAATYTSTMKGEVVDGVEKEKEKEINKESDTVNQQMIEVDTSLSAYTVSNELSEGQSERVRSANCGGGEANYSSEDVITETPSGADSSSVKVDDEGPQVLVYNNGAMKVEPTADSTCATISGSAGGNNKGNSNNQEDELLVEEATASLAVPATDDLSATATIPMSIPVPVPAPIPVVPVIHMKASPFNIISKPGVPLPPAVAMAAAAALNNNNNNNSSSSNTSNSNTSNSRSGSSGASGGPDTVSTGADTVPTGLDHTQHTLSSSTTATATAPLSPAAMNYSQQQQQSVVVHTPTYLKYSAPLQQQQQQQQQPPEQQLQQQQQVHISNNQVDVHSQQYNQQQQQMYQYSSTGEHQQQPQQSNASLAPASASSSSSATGAVFTNVEQYRQQQIMHNNKNLSPRPGMATGSTAGPLSGSAKSDNNPPLSKTIKLEDLRKYFHLPIVEVARELGTCTTALKKICRKHSIFKWPYRQIRSITKSIQSLEMASLNDTLNEDLRNQYRQQIVTLQSAIDDLIKDPNKVVTLVNMGLTEDFYGQLEESDMPLLLGAGAAAAAAAAAAASASGGGGSGTGNLMDAMALQGGLSFGQNRLPEGGALNNNGSTGRALAAGQGPIGSWPKPSLDVQQIMMAAASVTTSATSASSSSPRVVGSSSSSGVGGGGGGAKSAQKRKREDDAAVAAAAGTMMGIGGSMGSPVGRDYSGTGGSFNGSNSSSSSNAAASVSIMNAAGGFVHNPVRLMEIGTTTVQYEVNPATNKMSFNGPVTLATLQRKKPKPNANRKVVPLMEPDVGSSFEITFMPQFIYHILEKAFNPEVPPCDDDGTLFTYSAAAAPIIDTSITEAAGNASSFGASGVSTDPLPDANPALISSSNIIVNATVTAGGTNGQVPSKVQQQLQVGDDVLSRSLHSSAQEAATTAGVDGGNDSGGDSGPINGEDAAAVVVEEAATTSCATIVIADGTEFSSSSSSSADPAATNIDGRTADSSTGYVATAVADSEPMEAVQHSPVDKTVEGGREKAEQEGEEESGNSNSNSGSGSSAPDFTGAVKQESYRYEEKQDGNNHYGPNSPSPSSSATEAALVASHNADNSSRSHSSNSHSSNSHSRGAEEDDGDDEQQQQQHSLSTAVEEAVGGGAVAIAVDAQR